MSTTKYSDIAVTSKIHWDKYVLSYTASLVYIMDNRAKIVLFSKALESSKKALLMNICHNDCITTIEVPYDESIHLFRRLENFLRNNNLNVFQRVVKNLF